MLKLFCIRDFYSPPHPRFNDGVDKYRSTKAVPPLAFLHHWTGGAGSGEVDEKRFNFMSTTDRCVGHKSSTFCNFMCNEKMYHNFENLRLRFWILDFGIYPDPKAPLVVVLRGDSTTRGAMGASTWCWHPETQKNRFLWRVQQQEMLCFLVSGDYLNFLTHDNTRQKQRKVDFLQE